VLIDVKGSCADLRARSRSFRSSSSSLLRSWFLSEYHGFMSFVFGASGTPLSVSSGSAFLLVLIAIGSDCYTDIDQNSRREGRMLLTRSKSSKKLI